MLTRPDERRSLIRAARRACSSWCSTSCTPTAAARAPTSRCWSAGCGALRRRRHCSASAPPRRWPPRARAREQRARSSPRWPPDLRRHGERRSTSSARPSCGRPRRSTDPTPARTRRVGRPAPPADYAAPGCAIRSPPGSRRRSASTDDERRPAVVRRPSGRRCSQAARLLAHAERAPIPAGAATKAIGAHAAAGSRARTRTPGRPLFAFRLHQFLSKGDTVYVTLEHENARHITRDYQVEQPGGREDPAARWRSAASAARSTWWSGGGSRRAPCTTWRGVTRSHRRRGSRRLRRLPLHLPGDAVATGRADGHRRPSPARIVAGGLRPHRRGRYQAHCPQVPAAAGDRRCYGQERPAAAASRPRSSPPRSGSA